MIHKATVAITHKRERGGIGKLYIEQSGKARGLNAVTIGGFTEDMTLEEELVRGRGGSHLDSGKGNILAKALKWRLALHGKKRASRPVWLEKYESN